MGGELNRVNKCNVLMSEVVTCTSLPRGAPRCADGAHRLRLQVGSVVFTRGRDGDASRRFTGERRAKGRRRGRESWAVCTS
jgi:hypothetical protein